MRRERPDAQTLTLSASSARNLIIFTRCSAASRVCSASCARGRGRDERLTARGGARRTTLQRAQDEGYGAVCSDCAACGVGPHPLDSCWLHGPQVGEHVSRHAVEVVLVCPPPVSPRNRVVQLRRAKAAREPRTRVTAVPPNTSHHRSALRNTAHHRTAPARPAIRARVRHTQGFSGGGGSYVACLLWPRVGDLLAEVGRVVDGEAGQHAPDRPRELRPPERRAEGGRRAVRRRRA
jgi:hypothetical protein